MNNFFFQYLNVSLHASIACILLWLLMKSPIRRIFTASSILLLWIFLFIRFLIPIQIEIPTNLLPSLSPEMSLSGLFDPIWDFPSFQFGEIELLTAELSTRHISNPSELDFVDNPSFPVLKLIWFLWILGIIILMITHFIHGILFQQRLKRAKPIGDSKVLAIYNSLRMQLGIQRSISLFEMEGIGTAAIIGVFKPNIMISPELLQNFDEDHLHSVLLHELTHYRKHHLIFNVMGLTVCALHWFNPFIWLGYRELRRAIELACDEASILTFSITTPETYARHLVNLMVSFPCAPQRRLGFLGLFNNLKSRFISQRINMIQNHSTSKLPVSLVLLFGLTALCIASTTYSSIQMKDSSVIDLEIVNMQTVLPIEQKAHEKEITNHTLKLVHVDQLDLDFDEFALESELSDGAKDFFNENKIKKLYENEKGMVALEILTNSSYVDESNVQFIIGNLYLQNNQLAEAEMAYIHSVNRARHFRAFRNLYYLYLDQKHFSTARPLIEKYLQAYDDPNAQDYLWAGICAMMEEDFEIAIEHFQQSLLMDPENNDIRENLSKSYLLNENYQMAEVMLDELIDRTDDPVKLSRYHKYHANVDIGLDDMEGVIKHLLIHLELSPEDKQAQLLLQTVYANIASANRETEQMISYYLKIIELNPEDNMTRAYLEKTYADLAFSEGNMEEASGHFQKMIELNPEDNMTRAYLAIGHARIAFAGGDDKKGIELTQKYLALNPEDNAMREFLEKKIISSTGG